MRSRRRPTVALLALIAACGSETDAGLSSPDAMTRPDGGVLFGGDDASTPAPDAMMMMPPPMMDGSMPPPMMDGGMPPMMDGGMMMGPRPCTVESECVGACPPESIGCTCHAGPMGRMCVPTCNMTSDCPSNSMVTLVCDTQMNICVPMR